MSRKQVDTIWLVFSIFCFLMLSVSFLLMPLGSETPSEKFSVYSLVAGLMFWISIIMGIVTQYVLAARRKKWYIIHRIRKNIKPSQKIGLLSFFKNTYATVADGVLIISLIGLVITMIATKGTGFICYIFVSLVVFSFSLHCILNGKIYYHVINQNKLLKTVENERANSSK